MDKIIIFLGAGASKADGAPLQNELFKSYINASKQHVQNKNYTKVISMLEKFDKMIARSDSNILIKDL